MKRLISWFNIIIKKRRELKRWQRVVTVLAAVTTFVTTYALILPAITVERDNTGDVGGMYLEQSAEQDVMVEEDALEPSGISIDAEQEDAAAYEYTDDAHAVRTLTVTGDDYTIVLTYDESSKIPEGAYLTASEISQDSGEYKTYLEETKKAMGLAEEETLPRFAARFFDIKIMVGDEEFTPEAGVSVEITYAEPLAEKADAEVNAVHFADKKADVEVIEANTTEIQDGGAATVEFTAESFSVYGVIYTVDFNWGVDGETFEYSLAGGDSVSFRKLVEVLGVMDAVNSAADNTENSNSRSTIDEFVDDVENVEFSDESLVKVARITEGITAGALKEKLEIESEYSAELTETQIEEINSQVFYAPDWALISLKAFTSEEYLTVTMKNGEVFTIAVTDAQIKKTVIDAKGDTWEVTVNYDDEAGIPDGANLEVEELAEGTAEYQKYLKNSANELRAEADDISFARFFDITIVDKEGNKVEPETPVTVQIEYMDAIEIGEKEYLSVVHFADKGIEVIDNIDLNEENTTVTYTQNSFSVTGTIVNSAPRNGQSYMLIVDYEGEKYIINNDSTLIPVSTVSNSQISTDYPMLWTYNYQYGGNFRIASEATGFDANNVAAGFYYRYIDPNVDSGLTEEDAQHPNLSGSTQVNYNNNLISSARNNNLYIGVSEEGGTLHIVGNQQGASKAAKITLYNPGNVRSADPANHSVNHIDVSISGDADVNIPLAYGIYYYKEGNTWHKLIVGADVPDVTGDGVSPENTTRVDNHTENLKAGHISITSTDMKSATITAKRHDNNAVVNDAFYITGYSANHSTEYSTDQVRIEGSFKVADMDPVNNDYWTVNSYDTRSRRLQNIIDYTVAADKRLNLPLTYTVGGNSYALYKDPVDDAEQVSVVATVNLSATFNYWDHEGDNNPANDGNECPPLQPGWGYDNEWKNGGIQPYGISGMDFVLHGKGTTVAKVLALEITKTLKFLDEDGSVESVQYNQPITFDYEVFTDQPGDPSTVRVPGGEVHDYGTYKALNSTEITVRPTTDGSNSGHVYDYDVTDGMYYVREVRDDNFPTELTIGGDTYRYVSTNIKTEYSYRHNQYRDRETGYHQMHEVDISSETADLNSIPEVLGTYTADDGQEENNEFLEYYFENVYKKNATPPPPEPVIKTLEINLDKKWRDGDDTTAPTNGTVTFKLHRIATTTRENGHDIASPQSVTDGDGFPKTMTISSLEDWKITIPNLTYYESDTQRTYERTYKYYLEETERTGDAERYGVPSFTNGFGSIHNPVEGQDNDEPITVEVENKTGNVLRIQKRWLNVDPDVAPNVVIKLWRQELKPEGSVKGNPEQIGENIILSNSNRVNGENWWQVEIPLPDTSLPEYTDYGYWTPENDYQVYPKAYGDYAYYISEANLNGSGTNDYQKPRYYKLVGDEAIDDYQAWAVTGPGDQQGIGFDYEQWGNHGAHPETTILASDGKDGTLIVMNAPNNTFHHVYFSKEWYKYENGQFVKAGNNDTRNYAIGIQIYQRLKSGGNNGEWHPFAKPIYIGAPNGIIDNGGKNYIMDPNNPFVFNENPTVDNNGVWRWLLRDEGAQNGFPRYAMVNGQKVYYEYEAREIGVYTTENGQKASSVDQLQRVYDYSNIQSWNFDESAGGNQQHGPNGINVEAGKLNVTKSWQGGHTGSKIYFKVYRGNEDITASIVADPESYGLTEHQVLDDGTHKALIVTSDGTNWTTLLIQGLAEAPAGGGSAYVYSIKEIGYAEADGTDWWDGEVVTNPDGSPRKDPRGNDIVAHVSDLLTGYQIDSGGNQSPVNGSSPGTTVVDDETHTITVNNTYVEKYKDFEFTKVWENGTGEFQTWPADISSIKIDLYAKAGTGDPVKIADGVDFYVTPPTQDSKQEFTWNGVKYKWRVSVDPSGTIYTFKIPDLPAKDVYPNGNDYEYSVVEQSMDDYETRYGSISDTQKPVEGTNQTITVKTFVDEEATFAANGKVISNKKDEPQTGALKITKAVTVNGEAPTDANKAKTNGTFEFTVAGIPETETAGVTHTVKITFADGKATSYQIDTQEPKTVSGTDNTWSVVLDNLTPGEYAITETAPNIEGMSLKTVTGSNVTSNVATVTVTAGDTEASQTAAQVTFTNNYTEYEVVIVKAETGNTATKIGGAEFDLYAASSVEEKEGKTVPKSDATPINGSNKLISSSAEGDDKGKVSLGTLTAGTYYLFETKAPAGYIPMDMPVTIAVADGKVTLMQGSRVEIKTVEDNTITNAKTEITVMNSTGFELPHTGGAGVNSIYLLGFTLIGLAGIGFLMKRRSSHTEI